MLYLIILAVIVIIVSAYVFLVIYGQSLIREEALSDETRRYLIYIADLWPVEDTLPELREIGYQRYYEKVRIEFKYMCYALGKIKAPGPEDGPHMREKSRKLMDFKATVYTSKKEAHQDFQKFARQSKGTKVDLPIDFPYESAFYRLSGKSEGFRLVVLHEPILMTLEFLCLWQGDINQILDLFSEKMKLVDSAYTNKL